jgi:hypothetical protein
MGELSRDYCMGKASRDYFFEFLPNKEKRNVKGDVCGG